MSNILSSWRRCDKCQCVWFSVYGSESVCPAGGNHHFPDDTNRPVLAIETADTDGDPPGRQNGWHRCMKCAGLIFPDAPGRCPKDGGNHQAFAVRHVIDIHQSQQTKGDFQHCTKCSTLFARAFTPSVCAAGGAHVPYNSSYSLLPGSWLEELNVIYPMQGSNDIGMISSPDGTVGNLNSGQRRLFGNPTYAGGTVSGAYFKGRVWYAHISNDAENLLLLSSKPAVGVQAGGPERGPAPTGVGIIGAPDRCAPAIVAFKGNLYIFFVNWDDAGHGYGPLKYVKITVTDTNGSFVVSSATQIGGGSEPYGRRITAAVSNGRLFVSTQRVFSTNGNFNNFAAIYQTSDMVNWTASNMTYPTYDGYGSFLAMPDGNIVFGFRASNDGKLNYSYYYPSNNGWSTPQEVQITVDGPISWVTAANNSCTILAWRGGDGSVKICRLLAVLPGPTNPPRVNYRPVIEEIRTLEGAKSSTPLLLLAAFESGVFDPG